MRTRAHTYAQTHTQIHTQIHTHTYTHTHKHIHKQRVDSGVARSRILTFPSHGELYNIIEPAGFAQPQMANFTERDVDTHLMLAAKIVMTDDTKLLLPVQVLNYTDGHLRPLPPGPWTGSLYYPPLTPCTCKSVSTLPSSSSCKGGGFEVDKKCQGEGEFENSCGVRGTDVLVLRYAQRVFAEEVVIASWLPDSCRLRVLALHPGAHSATCHPVSQNTTEIRRFTSATASAAGIQETRVNPALSGQAGTGTTFVSPPVDTVLTGCGGLWEPLWEGSVIDIRDATSAEHLRLPLDPPTFETDTLLLQVCGLHGLGIGMTEGGNQLEGLRAVSLRGTIGSKPRGLVEHSAQRLAYRRFAGADGLMQGGVDTFSFSAFEGGENAQKKAVMSLKLAPRVKAARTEYHQIYLAAAGQDVVHSVPLIQLGESEGGKFVKQYVIFTQLPSRGVLSGLQGESLASSATHACATTTIIGSLLSSSAASSQITPAIQYERTTPNPSVQPGKGAYDSFAYVVCSDDEKVGGQVIGHRHVTVHLECELNWYQDEATSECYPCAAGTGWVSHKPGVAIMEKSSGGAQGCVACDAGYNRSTSSPRCSPCPRGFAAPEPGSSRCTECAPGSYAPSVGLATCIACPAGKTAEDTGSVSCAECGPRSYSPVEGLARCLSCPNRTVTNSMTSISINHCECAGGSYHKLARIGEGIFD